MLLGASDATSCSDGVGACCAGAACGSTAVMSGTPCIGWAAAATSASARATSISASSAAWAAAAAAGTAVIGGGIVVATSSVASSRRHRRRRRASAPCMSSATGRSPIRSTAVVGGTRSGTFVTTFASVADRSSCSGTSSTAVTSPIRPLMSCSVRESKEETR